MSRTGIAGVGCGLVAVALAIVNMTRVSGAIGRMQEALDGAKTGPRNEASAQEKPETHPEDRAAEMEYLKREMARISGEVEKARVEMSTRVTAPDTTQNPDAEPGLKLTAADVAAAMDRILENKWKDQKLREAELKIVVLERGAASQLATLEMNLGLKPEQKTAIQAILKSQVDGYADILRMVPPPDDFQERLDKVTKNAEAQIDLQLSAEQQKVSKRVGPNWHGFSPQNELPSKRGNFQPKERK